MQTDCGSRRDYDSVCHVGDLFQVSFDVDREPPVTPNLFVNAQKPDLQNVTPSCSACVHGPTPANTPAAGCVAELPAPNLLSQAVNELKGVRRPC